MRKFITLSLLALVGSVLPAQSTEYSVKTGLVNAQGDMVNLTQRHLGYFFEGGVKFTLTEPDLSLYVHAGHLTVRAKQEDLANNCDVKNAWVGLDLLYPVKTTGLTIFTGPTLNTFDVKAQKTGAYPDTSWKFGWRLGTKYQITKSVAVDAVYNFAEWTRFQTKDRLGALQPMAAYRPSWLTVGVSYTF
ncbi:MAG: outer membrane beta-barrel protein [Holophaga sp.]|nr:outer membrane beta-barrel protein [Holophaga sp.]